jgi:hypothetical protein
MLRKLGDFLLAKERNATMVALIFILLPLLKIPLGSVAAIIVAFVTLARGAKAGFWVVVWIALPAISLLYLKQVGGFDTLLLYGVVAWGAAIILRRYASWSLVLEAGTLLGIVVIVALHLIVPDLQQWWAGVINNTIKELIKLNVWTLPTKETTLLVKRMAPLATGVSAFRMLSWSLILTLFARWWFIAIKQPGTLRDELLSIRAGLSIVVVAAVSILGALFRVGVFLDILPLLALPFAVAGLSLLHFLANKNRALLVPLILIYVGFLFLPLFAIIVLTLVLLGLTDSLANFRKRLLRYQQ